MKGDTTPQREGTLTWAPKQHRITIGGLMLLVSFTALILFIAREPGKLLILIYVVFVGWPFFLHSILRINADPTYQPFDPEDFATPPAVAEQIRQVSTDLAGLGFVTRGHFRKARPDLPGAGYYITLFEHPQTLDATQLISVLGGTKTVTTLSFWQSHADGSFLITTDDDTWPVLPPAPGLSGLAFPGIRSVSDLYQVHRARAAAQPGIPRRLFPAADGDLETYLQDWTTQEWAWSVANNDLYLDERSGHYLLTWKGAALIVVKSIWLALPIRRAWRRRKTARALRELGLR